eukprot:TRINITY_DN24979_c0_g1_i1.p2 TRINITY_DN24979_c0_g1~~TRINITY_DN24979_c0_g1_i1.p2  ORF type:complete len:101 (+),score=0.42 TRINITY_DN24979_c0_g1_i1:113-415(+)
MISTTRTALTDKERAKSLANPVTLLTFTPAANSNSKRVIIGPGLTNTTLASTEKSKRRASTSADKLCKTAVENFFEASSGVAISNKLVLGKSLLLVSLIT